MKEKAGMKKKAIGIGLCLAAVAAVAVFTGISGKAEANADKRLLIHYKTGFDKDDNQACVAFNMALTGLRAGYKVGFLFDASGVFDLQNGDPSAGASSGPASRPASTSASRPVAASTSRPAEEADVTPYRLRYELPEDLRMIISQYFNVPQNLVSHDYYEYVKWLRSQGVEITVNGTMAQLVSLASSPHRSEYLGDAATPLDLSEMLSHMGRVNLIVSY
jgi:hypothetical protein